MKTLLPLILTSLILVPAAHAQEARRRWEMQRQIRLDKFEQVLPLAMRANGIDMWIVAVKENHYDPLWEDLGRGYVSGRDDSKRSGGSRNRRLHLRHYGVKHEAQAVAMKR